MGLLSMYWRGCKPISLILEMFLCTWSCTFMENSVISQAEARMLKSFTMLQSLTTCGTLWDSRGVIWIFLFQEMRHLCGCLICVCIERSHLYIYMHILRST